MEFTESDFTIVERASYAPTMRSMDGNAHIRLKQARVAAGYRTAKEFSDSHQMPQSTYSTHEKGTRPLTMESAGVYADILGIKAAWLLFGDEGRPSESADLVTDSKLLPTPQSGIPKLDQVAENMAAAMIGFVEQIEARRWAVAQTYLAGLAKQISLAQAHCTLAAEQEIDAAAEVGEDNVQAKRAI